MSGTWWWWLDDEEGKCCAAEMKNENSPLIFMCARISSCRYQVFPSLPSIFKSATLFFVSFCCSIHLTSHSNEEDFSLFFLLATAAVDSSFQWRIWLFYSNLLQPRYVTFFVNQFSTWFLFSSRLPLSWQMCGGLWTSLYCWRAA